MRHPESARLFSAREYDASRMTCLLRGLDLLVTSRYHAAVLSLAAGVPQVAVHHDTRLATLYGDLGLKEKWFLDPGAAEDLAGTFPALTLFKELGRRVELLLENPGMQKDSLDRGYAEHLALARKNRNLLGQFIADRGLEPDLPNADRGRRGRMRGVILLTGATGFLGSQVARGLLSRHRPHGGRAGAGPRRGGGAAGGSSGPGASGPRPCRPSAAGSSPSRATLSSPAWASRPRHGQRFRTA